jgi:uncharacterized protein with GYD domain
MLRFVMLLKFTDKGIATIKESPSRAEAFQAAAAKAEAVVESQFWTLGEYDGVLVLRASDELSAVGLALELGRHGNVRTCLLRAFDAGEFKGILNKMP